MTIQKIKKKIDDEIGKKVNKVFKLKKKGVNLIFPDVDNIKGILLKELKKEEG